MYASHGGACCGYGHIHTLDGMSVQQFDTDFARHLAAARGDNRVCEVILSSRQVASPPPARHRHFHESIVEFGGWPTFLASRGFRRGATWRNSNTNNMCYQFLHCPVFEESSETDLPILPTVALPPPREVSLIRTPPRFNVGELVALRSNPNTPFEVVQEVSDAAVQLRNVTTGRLRNALKSELIHAQYSSGGEEPAPVDPALPVAVRDLETGDTYEGSVASSGEGQVRVYIEDRREYPSTTTGRIQAGTPIRGATWYYDRATGNFSGSNPAPLRAFNPGVRETVTIPRPAAPALEPTVILEEVFAQYRDGRTRGPFNYEEEAREAYPRVRSFFARRVLSDGSTVRVDL
jgi:hypothetical protein